MSLKHKKILITAGPTWVPIDDVRVISSIATGETGILLAEKLQKLGAKVTLLLGPIPNAVFLCSVSSGFRRDTEVKATFGMGACCLDKKIKLIRFRFFDELKNTIVKELKSKKYDVIIHSAAVSDYKPAKIYKQKVKSGIKNWRLNLIPTEKIIDLIKKIDESLFLVGFKFETDADKNRLIQRAKVLIDRANLDLAVANTIKKNRYQAYIVNQNKIYGSFYNKNDLTNRLINIIGKT